MTSGPAVSVVIPVLNEEADIAGCIEAVAAQDMGVDRIELLLVDGCSNDATVLVAHEAAARHRFHGVHVLSNPRRLTSVSLNAGLKAATGACVVRIDARSRIEPHYVRRCLTLLEERAEIGVVGGAQWARARGGGCLHVGIARALQNRWSTGLSRYRRKLSSGPTDTVWMGAFRTDDLRALGGWDEAVALNEDYELAARYRAAGAIVWFEGSLRSGYLPRQGLSSLALQYFRFDTEAVPQYAPCPFNIILPEEVILQGKAMPFNNAPVYEYSSVGRGPQTKSSVLGCQVQQREVLAFDDRYVKR